MLYVFYGKDSFSRRERLDELRASLDADGMLASNTVFLDGRKATPAEVMAACDTAPFLASHRLVIVEGLLARLTVAGRGRRGGKPPAGEAEWLSLAGYIDRMPPSTHLVLLDGEIKGQNSLLGALKGKGEVREFRPPDQRALPQWIRDRARSLDLSLTAGAARMLADFIGDDLWALAGELEKLSIFAEGRQVAEDDVRALVTAVREVSVFPLVDTIVEERPAAALKLLRRMLRQEAQETYLLAMVQRQFRHLAIAREMLDAGATGARIGEAVGLRGFPLDKLLEQASRYPGERVRAAFQRLLAADLQIKRGVYDGELALELLVYDLAAEKSPAAA